MATISEELKTFKSKMDGATGNMSSKCSEITTKLSNINDACSAVKSGLSSSYQSEYTATVTATVDSIANIASAVTSSISSTLQAAISEADALVAKIKKLEDLEEDIKELKSKLSGIPNDDEHKSERSSLQSKISEKDTQLQTDNDAALADLASLKAKDGAIEISTNSAGASDNTTEQAVEEIKVLGGTLKKYFYKADNGKTVSYYMYVPKTDSTTKLPMTIYFHGLHETADKNPDRGLYGLINSGKITPQGIVIMPQADEGTTDQDFNRGPYLDAVLELTKKVASSCNGDVTRLSVAGHSNGACAVGHMVANHPGVFAAAAPISGTTNASEGMFQTNLWSFRGSYDSPDVDRSAKIIQKKGGTKVARYTVFPKKGHAIQTYTFEQTLEDENGKQTTLLEWLMSKKLG